MKNILYILQIIVSSFLIFLILIQQKRGGTYLKRRGAEKIVFFLTVFFGTLFVLFALLNLLIQ